MKSCATGGPTWSARRSPTMPLRGAVVACERLDPPIGESYRGHPFRRFPRQNAKIRPSHLTDLSVVHPPDHVGPATRKRANPVQDEQIPVTEGYPVPMADSFHLGTDTLRLVYRGDDPDDFLMEHLTDLETQGFRIRNYSCDHDNNSAEIRAAHLGLRSMSVMGIVSDIYLDYRDTSDSLIVETGAIFVTAYGGKITWVRKEGAVDHAHDTGGQPDPATGGTTARASLPGPGTGSPTNDPGEQERDAVPDTSPAHG